MNGNYLDDGDDEIQTIGKKNSKRNWKQRQRISSSDSSSAAEDEQHELLLSKSNEEHAPVCDRSAEADHHEGVSSTRKESPTDLETRKKRKRITQTGKSSSEDGDKEVVASSVDRLSDGVADLVFAENESFEQQQPSVDVKEKQNETSEIANSKALSFSLQLIAKLDVAEVVGVAKLRKKICVLRESPTTLDVYDDGKSPVRRREIALDEIEQPTEIAACRRTKYLYVGDRRSLSLWRFKLKSCDEGVSGLEKWMEDIENLWTFSVDACGRIVLPRNRPADCVCVYDRDAHLLHRIFLPESLSRPGHALLRSNGSVVISHSHMRVLSELNSSGAQVRRFPATLNGEMLMNRFLFRHFVVLDDGRILACDGAGNGFVLLDRKLQRIEVVPLEDSGISDPERIHYDAGKRQVIAVGTHGVEIFKLVEH